MKMRVLAMILTVLLAIGCVPAMAESEAESGWTNILFMGGDARSTQPDEFNLTDSIMIVSINREESQLKLTSVMRDTWVTFSNGKSNKINAGNNFGGPEMTIEAINSNFGMDIEDYVIVNMDDLAHIIDLVGGVDIDVTASERKYTNMYIEDYLANISNKYEGDTYLEETGLVHVNGLIAMSYTRDRYSDSDFGRVMRQQEVLLSLGKQLQNMEVDALMEVVGEIMEHMQTSLTEEEMKDLAMVGMTVEVEDIGQYRIPAEGAYESGTFDGTWMIKADFEKNTELLHEFIYGEE